MAKGVMGGPAGGLLRVTRRIGRDWMRSGAHGATDAECVFDGPMCLEPMSRRASVTVARKSFQPALAGQLLLAFESKRLDSIGAARVRCWFYAISRTAPGNANLGRKPFRQIMDFAVALVRSAVWRSCPTQGLSTCSPAVHEPRPSRANHCARMAVGIRQRTEH